MKKEDVNPVGDQLFFEIIVAERTTEAGLVLPGAEDEYSPVIGKLLKVAPNVTDFSPGQKIMLSRGVSFKVPLGGYASKDAAYLVDKKYILATLAS